MGRIIVIQDRAVETIEQLLYKLGSSPSHHTVRGPIDGSLSTDVIEEGRLKLRIVVIPSHILAFLPSSSFPLLTVLLDDGNTL